MAAVEPRGVVLIGAMGGGLVPFSTLGAGAKAQAVLEYYFAGLPLGLSLGAGYERHTALLGVMLPPPAGGLDPAAIENQVLVPVEVALAFLPWRDDESRVSLSAGYGAVGVWTQAQALGSTRDEAGVGHQLGLEAGYSRKVGPVELLFRARYTVRHTAVGARTSAMELPWYQAAGLLVGCGLGL